MTPRKQHPTIKPLTADEFEIAANNLARNYVVIRTCKKCTYPVVCGYSCNTCGDSSPSQTYEQDADFAASIRERLKK